MGFEEPVKYAELRH